MIPFLLYDYLRAEYFFLHKYNICNTSKRNMYNIITMLISQEGWNRLNYFYIHLYLIFYNIKS